MAADYSRQLSEKVFYGSVKVSEQGYSAGGAAPYGMVRVLLNETKKPVQTLKSGEHKVIANQRIIFAPANDQTTDTVKAIFSFFIEQQYTPTKIASFLNEKRIPSANGLSWNRDKIVRILTNETYIGTRIYNKTWSRLKKRQHPNPRSEWIICPNAFEAIISQGTFNKAQECLYWSNPFRWRRGVYITNKIKRRFREYLIEFLKNQLNMSEGNIWSILRYFPMSIGATFYRGESIRHWCFTIQEQMKQHKYILGVAVDIFKSDSIDRFFLIPTSNFGLGNFLAFGEQYPQYSTYLINPEAIEKNILDLCKALT